ASSAGFGPLVLPHELAFGVDEVSRRQLGDGEHLGPAAFVILGELHQRPPLALRRQLALDLAARAIECTGREDHDHHEGGGLLRSRKRGIERIQGLIPLPIREMHEHVARQWLLARNAGLKAGMRGDYVAEHGVVCHPRSPDRQGDGSKPNRDIHLNPDFARAACRSPRNADFLASRQGLRAFDAQADLTELRGGRGLGKDEAMLVGEGLFDAPSRVGRRVLHPRPDEAGGGRAALPISPRTIRPSGVIRIPVNVGLAKESKVRSPRAVSNWDLTMFTAVSWKIHDRYDGSMLTSGSPTRARIACWFGASSTNVINCVKLTEALGDHHLFPESETVPEIAIPPLWKTAVGPEVKCSVYVTEMEIPNGPLNVELLAVEARTNGVDIDLAEHIVAADADGESARTDERLGQRLNPARWLGCARQLERQRDHLARTGAETFEFRERKIRRQIDRGRVEAVAQEVAHVHGK